MYLAAMISEIKKHLNESGTNVWSDSEITACIEKAVSDLSRMVPQEKILDITTSFAVTDEDWSTNASTLATAVTLGYTGIKPQSEVVENTAGTVTFVRGTDYTMDYNAGTITPISPGATPLVKNTAYHISYTKLKIGVDISSIASTLLRVDRVEYPAGQVPQQFVSFRKWGNFLTLVSSLDGSQATMAEGKTVNVYYFADQAAPVSTATNGTYPAFLDDVVITGAISYALDLKVIKMRDAARASAVLAAGYLTSGDDFINTVNVGGPVAEAYKNYCDSDINIAMFYEKSADGFKLEADKKRAEFWSVLADKMQLKLPPSMTTNMQGKA